MTPQKFRELILQILYSTEKAGTEEAKELIELISKEAKVTKKNVRDAIDYVAQLKEQQEQIDELLLPAIKGYRLDRLHDMDRAILRLSVYEVKFLKEINGSIMVAEAIRLAKKYSTPEAGAFVHGVLDAVLKKEEE